MYIINLGFQHPNLLREYRCFGHQVNPYCVICSNPTWMIHIKMVVSVGWLEIIAWKIGVVQFPSRSGWLSGTWLHKSHLRRSRMHRSAGWIHMMMSGDGGKGNRKQRVTLVDEATVDYRSTPMLRWQGDRWQNCGTCRTRWMTPSQCQTRSTAWSSGARLSSRCRNTLGRCSKCWTRCGLEIECQKYCGWIMATCGNPSILPDGALLTSYTWPYK